MACLAWASLLSLNPAALGLSRQDGVIFAIFISKDSLPFGRASLFAVMGGVEA
jgi:hypothetical protein